MSSAESIIQIVSFIIFFKDFTCENEQQTKAVDIQKLCIMQTLRSLSSFSRFAASSAKRRASSALSRASSSSWRSRSACRMFSSSDTAIWLDFSSSAQHNEYPWKNSSVATKHNCWRVILKTNKIFIQKLVKCCLFLTEDSPPGVAAIWNDGNTKALRVANCQTFWTFYIIKIYGKDWSNVWEELSSSA